MFSVGQILNLRIRKAACGLFSPRVCTHLHALITLLRDKPSLLIPAFIGISRKPTRGWFELLVLVYDLTLCRWNQPKWVSSHQVITFSQPLPQPKCPHPLPTADPAHRKARAVLLALSVWWDEDEVMRWGTNLRFWAGEILPLSLLHKPLGSTEVRLCMKTPRGAFAVNLANLFLYWNQGQKKLHSHPCINCAGFNCMVYAHTGKIGPNIHSNTVYEKKEFVGLRIKHEAICWFAQGI